MKAYDVLSLGNTDLMLMPLCGEHFTWEQSPGEKSNDTGSQAAKCFESVHWILDGIKCRIQVMKYDKDQ